MKCNSVNVCACKTFSIELTPTATTAKTKPNAKSSEMKKNRLDTQHSLHILLILLPLSSSHNSGEEDDARNEDVDGPSEEEGPGRTEAL